MGLLNFFSMAIILAVGYSHFREGFFIAAIRLVAVVLAGLTAFSVYEPLANELEPSLTGFLDGYADALCLVGVFAAVYGALTAAASALAVNEPKLPNQVIQPAGGALGLVTGYFLAGFLLCVLQTLPWHEHFLGFQPRKQAGWTNRNMPPDETWLRLVTALSRGSLVGNDATKAMHDFEPGYTEHRRYGDNRDALPQKPEPEPTSTKPTATPPTTAAPPK